MNLLITGAWQGAAENIKVLEDIGHAVTFLQFEKDRLPCDYEWVEGVICNNLFLHHPIENFVNLRYIQLTSAGYDRIPMEYVEEHNIQIYNARGVYSIPMAEFAICGVLQIYKQSAFFRNNQNNHRWEKHRGLLELNGKTVCIVGCGSVGTECAKRFRAFGCKVIGVNRTVREDLNYDEMVHINDIDLYLPKADIIIISVALTTETRYLIDKERISQLKSGFVLVNISRGAVVDQNELEQVLCERKGSAVLDVFEEEPLDKSSGLWELENVIVTPHNCFAGDNNSNRMKTLIIRNLTDNV